jgi:hypothetical protein
VVHSVYLIEKPISITFFVYQTLCAFLGFDEDVFHSDYCFEAITLQPCFITSSSVVMFLLASADSSKSEFRQTVLLPPCCQKHWHELCWHVSLPDLQFKFPDMGQNRFLVCHILL